MKSLILKYKKVSIVFVVVIIVIAYFVFSNRGDDGYTYVVAEFRDLVQEVSVTGRVVPAESVDLAFERTGRVSNIYINIGDSVYAGQTLISLENGDQLAQLNQAKANLEIQQATLDELNRGSRLEEIEVQKVKVTNAEKALQDSEVTLSDAVADAFTRADNAIRNNVDQFFVNPGGANPTLDLLVTNSQLVLQVQNERLFVENTLNAWSGTTAKSDLTQIKTFLDSVALTLNSAKPTTSTSQSTIDGYKTDVSTARTSVNTAISTLTSAEEGNKDSESALTLAEQELILKKAGATPEQLRIQIAKVNDAEASVLNYQVLLGKTIIKSPIGGIVTKQNINIGEIVSANSLVVSVISGASFKIETDIPEADIAKVDLTDPASVTLDAYGDDLVFPVMITSIEPAETIIEGVPTYTTTLQFVDNDDRIRSGMTANIDIITNTRENIIAIPARAVVTKNGDKFVRILEDKDLVEVSVETGIRGSDGTIEIIRGIVEGDKVITFLER